MGREFVAKVIDDYRTVDDFKNVIKSMFNAATSDVTSKEGLSAKSSPKVTSSENVVEQERMEKFDFKPYSLRK